MQMIAHRKWNPTSSVPIVNPIGAVTSPIKDSILGSLFSLSGYGNIKLAMTAFTFESDQISVRAFFTKYTIYAFVLMCRFFFKRYFLGCAIEGCFHDRTRLSGISSPHDESRLLSFGQVARNSFCFLAVDCHSYYPSQLHF
jgi:hypothetical protein